MRWQRLVCTIMTGGEEQSGGWWLCVIVKAWIKGGPCVHGEALRALGRT